ncbi:TMEM165/GDT1 family protein [Parashewanella spongiae]|uniref:GDT1 family protein n=1 Tax=Parashewanella spongiae TaxID=342950 RepID=A0A3A6U7F0_9GAMM|nr:TMEM165/GDT1 family protein [Parashewanella spongiae]MCL1079001.1 TMEM165/GDT1 family protein [Parashewanella spongiae]RJY17825.1 TMEM165/GDT1 family protein [Parashewanella spongiae]
MEALFISAFSVAIAEIGDKTQLLALLLAARFSNRTAIISGMLVATVMNHFLAAIVGEWISGWFNPLYVKYIIALSFFGVAAWILIPDKLESEESKWYRYGPFLATLLLFFIAEMGDKTQVATVLLAAKYQQLAPVITGTTIGVLLANVPVVFIGHFSAEKLPLKWIRISCACLFTIIGISTLLI